MPRLLSLAAALALLSCLDVPLVYPLRPHPGLPARVALPETLSQPDLFLAAAGLPAGKAVALQPRSKLEIIRYVDGEFAHAVKPLPAEKKGFRYKVGAPIDEQALRQALMHGTAANPGDTVQVTGIDFRAKEIVININGGTKGHFDWRKHIQIGVGNAPMGTTSGEEPQEQRRGAVLILDFGRPLPDMSADDVKQALAPFLDFSGERSSAENWVETLPPAFQQAIKNRTAVVGMNRDMVLAAMGRPDKKVRQWDENGKETEDWIYGLPPEKTVFVRFSGNKVIRVRQYD